MSVFQSNNDRTDGDVHHLNGTSVSTETETGCTKMSLCGVIEQKKRVHFMIVDNRKRVNPDIEVDLHIGTRTIQMNVEPHPTRPFTYELSFSFDQVGIAIMNVRFDGLQIPQSPVRVQIVERRCDLDYPGEKRGSTADGSCECDEGTFEIRGTNAS